MKHTLFKSAQMCLMATMLLILGTVSAHAQYQMVVHSDAGVSTPFFVNKVDSISYILATKDSVVNDVDEISVTGTASDIEKYSASVTSWVNVEDPQPGMNIGIIYTTYGEPSKSNGIQQKIDVSSLGSDGKYVVPLTDLEPTTTYYYRSYVYQGIFWSYGNVRMFTTKGDDVNLATGDVSKLTCYSAKTGGAVCVGATLQNQDIKYGICYGTNPVPSDGDNILWVDSKDSNGNFTCQLTALLASTTYYYRSFAYVDGHYNYGPIRSFTTKADDIVTTGDMDANTYTIKSTIHIGNGAYNKLEIGVCYGINEQPTVDDFKVTVNEVDNEDICIVKLTDMLADSIIYYRSYVLTDSVIHYGEIKSFVRTVIP